MRGYLAVMFLFIYAPSVSLVLFSFQKGRVQSFPIEEWSVKWYQEAWENRSLRESVITSVQVGTLVSIFATALGFVSANMLCRRYCQHELCYIALIALPSMIPSLLSGLALLMYFQRIHLNGTVFGIVAAHVCYTSPFAMVIIHNS
jgi:ABC-type spermidine/putrescine transport system permease subunit II